MWNAAGAVRGPGHCSTGSFSLNSRSMDFAMNASEGIIQIISDNPGPVCARTDSVGETRVTTAMIRREPEKLKPYPSSLDCLKILFGRKKAIFPYVFPEGNREGHFWIS